MDFKRDECLSCPARFVCAINIDMETSNCRNCREEIEGLTEGRDKTPVRTLNPSARLQNAFRIAKIKTVGDLKNISHWEWLAHRGIGAKVTNELNCLRHEHNIPWKPDSRG